MNKKINDAVRERVAQVRAKFSADLLEQVAFLRRSCEGYDKGVHAEAKRMSNAISLILIRRGRQTPLVDHLGIIDSISMLDTAEKVPDRLLMGFTGLAITHLGPNGMSYLPFCYHDPDGSKWVTLDTWLNTPVVAVLKDPATQPPPNTVPEAYVLSRLDLILTMRDQDGGAHVDEKIDAGYHRLKEDPRLGFVSRVNGKTVGPSGVALERVSMRQIAHETLRSLERAGLCPAVPFVQPPRPQGGLMRAVTVTLPPPAGTVKSPGQ